MPLFHTAPRRLFERAPGLARWLTSVTCIQPAARTSGAKGGQQRPHWESAAMIQSRALSLEPKVATPDGQFLQTPTPEINVALPSTSAILQLTNI